MSSSPLTQDRALHAVPAQRTPDVSSVRITDLVPGDSPRTTGLDSDHVRVLAEAAGTLPPILVHQATMRVLDGAHRLRAAQSRGDEVIDVRFYDGDDASAFVLAVRANIGHGLPLTLADRTAAAARILRAYPQWSDRRVAAVTGLSPKTAGAVRARSSEEIPQSAVRMGLDGRTRRVAPQPEAVGEAPARAAPAAPPPPTPPPPTPPSPPVRRRSAPRALSDSQAAVVQALRRDPSLRFSEFGRALLRLLDMHSVKASTWQGIVDNVPTHAAPLVSDLARDCAEAWTQLADCLDERTG